MELGFVLADDETPVARERAIMDVSLPTTLTEQMLDRICSEYIEMPGLQLTRRQARRLWGLDEETCTQGLDFLVDAKFLCRRGADTYARLTEGAVQFPPFRMAKVLYVPKTAEAGPVESRSRIPDAPLPAVVGSRLSGR